VLLNIEADRTFSHLMRMGTDSTKNDQF